jgi:hypothetical protein
MAKLSIHVPATCTAATAGPIYEPVGFPPISTESSGSLSVSRQLLGKFSSIAATN